MVDSIISSMNRIDIQRARVNENDSKQETKGNAIDKDLGLDKSELKVSEKVTKLAKQPPIDSEAVSRIKNAIADGKYPIDIDAVSDALMDAYREMKS
jgi:negative regulator of flagellin synthesis FlgM